jgi:hypothetical protein
MTTARRKRKLPPAGIFAQAGAVLGLVLLAGGSLPLLAATTERIVVDWRTGLAIHGFDPVAYFTDRKPLLGRPDLEYPFAGAVWRFHNVGNRAAFSDRPDIYAPRFGGYDPLAVARGVATPGHPLLWLIREDRLYLFHSAENRDAFAANASAAIRAADANWPKVERELVP